MNYFQILFYHLSLKKDEFISEIRKLRNTNNFHKISYSFIKKDDGLDLILTAEKIHLL